MKICTKEQTFAFQFIQFIAGAQMICTAIKSLSCAPSKHDTALRIVPESDLLGLMFRVYKMKRPLALCCCF
jgi:hypothetical protein